MHTCWHVPTFHLYHGLTCQTAVIFGIVRNGILKFIGGGRRRRRRRKRKKRKRKRKRKRRRRRNAAVTTGRKSKC